MIRPCARFIVGASAIMASPAFAQARNPFGVGISEGGGSAAGITGWLLAQQGWFEHQLSAGVRAVAKDPSAGWWLAGIGLVYGVFHAAGPGHGKAVLASYMVANERALRRGMLLSALAALLQGVVAIALVGTLALLLHATAQRMKDVAALIEMISFAGVACLGAWLVWRKAHAFVRLWRGGVPMRRGGSAGGRFGAYEAAMTTFSEPGMRRLAFAGTLPRTSRWSCVAVDETHEPGCLCHAADPAGLGGARLSWREAGLTVLAAGARPCSGAILVLVFALVQGVFFAGVGAVLAMSIGVAVTTGALASLAVLAKGAARRFISPGSRAGLLAVSGLELGAAVLVLLAGVGLLLGFALAG